MPSLDIIEQFQKQIGVSRETFLQALENTRGSQNARITAFYKQLLDNLIDEMQSGNIEPIAAEQWLRSELRRAAQTDLVSDLMWEAMQDDFNRISQFLNQTFDLLDRSYSIQEARILARDRLSDYVVSGSKTLNNRLAVEVGALSQSYRRGELYQMVANKVNAVDANIRTLTDNIVRGYDTEVVDNLAQQTGLMLWEYQGSLIEHSRRFCVHLIRLGNVYTKAQILKMDNGMKLNPFTFRGGYNCRHSWAPGEEGWPGFEHPYPKNGPFTSIPAEGGSYLITVPLAPSRLPAGKRES